MRTLFHVAGLTVPNSYLLWQRSTALIVTLSLCFLIALADWMRITGRVESPFLRRHLKEEELARPTGSIFYMAGCLASILLYGKTEAVASIFVLALSDPLSSIVGRVWGKRRLIFGKSIEGTGAFLCSSLLLLACFPFTPVAVAGAACAATATELLTGKVVNDNLSIPVVTGLALTLLATC